MTSLENSKTYHLTTAFMYFSSPPRRLTRASDVTLLRKIKSSHVSGPVGGKRKSNCEQMTKNFVAFRPVRIVSETIKQEVILVSSRNHPVRRGMLNGLSTLICSVGIGTVNLV